MPDGAQLSFMPGPEVQERVAKHVTTILQQHRQPSPSELVAELDQEIGIAARWDLEAVLNKLCADKDLPGLARAYLASLLEGDALKHEGEEHGGATREGEVENRFTTSLSYSFGERVIAVARIPWSHRELSEEGGDGTTERSHDLSDPELYALVRLWSSKFAPQLGRRAWLRQSRWPGWWLSGGCGALLAQVLPERAT